MLVKKYRSQLINIDNPFEGLYTLEFKSLNGGYKYYPGQFLHLTLDQNYDGSGQWPESRCFSMQSNPDQKTIKITYSVKGKYTSQMKEELKLGSDVWLKLPYGDLFTQPHNKTNTVFIAGGTGVTPYLSLFTDTGFSTYDHPLLYAGFRYEEMNLYKDQINSAYEINTTMAVYYLYQDKDGLLDIERIYNNSDKETSFFISGPPVMIKSFKDFLLKKGLKPDQIKTDDWE